MPQKCPKSLGVGGGGVCVVGKPNLVKCFGPRLRLWTWTLDFVPGPSFSIKSGFSKNQGGCEKLELNALAQGFAFGLGLWPLCQGQAFQYFV